jgi:hypothetical protein
MHPDGYWLQQNPVTRRYVGDGVEYGSFATTHYCLGYLSELGISRKTKEVEIAAERYLNLQSPDGDWYNHFSCLYGCNLRTFIRLGYRDDERIGRTIDLLLSSIRFDNGYLCDMHEPKSGRRKVKSCIRGSLAALEAFVELGEAYWNTPECIRLQQYFLDRNGIYKKNNLNEYVNKDVQTLVFPFHWRAGLLQILYCLSRMGHGEDARLKDAWALLEAKMDDQGRFPLEWAPTQCPWKVGQRGKENKWVTFYAYLALKYK